METPVYRLEGVVHEPRIDAPQDFEGPLDLILFLLSKNRIDIQDIPIALILEQYLAYLEQRKRLDLEIASEFVAMAAQLMFIKTRMLLSLEDEEAGAQMDELIRSLEERRQRDTYRRVRALAALLGPRGEFGLNTMTKNPEPLEQEKIYEYHQTPADLILAMQALRERAERFARPPLAALGEIVRREPYPVSEKENEILRLLRLLGPQALPRLFRSCRSRSEIVAVFIAVLELCRRRVICLDGENAACTVISLVRQEEEEEMSAS